MIPLIAARRSFIPDAVPAFVVEQLHSRLVSNTTSFTSTSVAIGNASSTRQYWLAVAAVSHSISATALNPSATLGGNAMTSRQLLQPAQAGGGYSKALRIFSLNGYTADTTANLVVSSAIAAYFAVVLLRVGVALSTTASDTGSSNANNGGTFNHTIDVPDQGIAFGAAINDASASTCAVFGMDNIVYTNRDVGHPRDTMSVAWHSSDTAESLATGFTAASSTSDHSCGIFSSFGQVP